MCKEYEELLVALRELEETEELTRKRVRMPEPRSFSEKDEKEAPA